MKQALEALEQHGTPLLNHEDAYSASLNALRQAIEDAEKQEPDDLTIAYMSGFYAGKNKDAPQPNSEQEPVAWMDEYGDVLSADFVDGNGLRNIPLYTAPPQRKWVGLTDEEIDKAWEWAQKSSPLGVTRIEVFTKSIEAKLREKNT